MSDYGDFARFYDKFTSNVDCPARARYFDTVIQKYNPYITIIIAADNESIKCVLGI